MTDPGDPEVAKGYDQMFSGLDYFRRVVGDDLLIVVLPDEFQVNDSLWQRIGGDSPALLRDLPQRRIRAYCERYEIDCLDLLPVLRSAEAQGHTYHLRDTHWNARGNREAGLALAHAIEEKLARDRR